MPNQKTERKDPREVNHFPALDGGWAWMVVLGFSVILALFGGFIRAFSLIYREWLNRYGQSDLKTSVAQSINVGTSMFSGPIASVLCNRFGHRKTVILGGLCCFSGLVITAVAPSLSVLYFGYGILTGFGISLVLVSSFSFIPVYFKRKRGLAMAFSTVTAGFGAFYSPMVMACLSEYGYTGTLLILSALHLNICVSGALNRPIEDNFPRNKRCMALEIIKDEQTFNVSNIEQTSDSEILKGKQLGTNMPYSNDRFGSFRNISLQNMDSITNIHEECNKHNPEQGNQVFNSLMKDPSKKNVFTSFCYQYVDLTLTRNVSYLLFSLSMAGAYFVANTSMTYDSRLAEEKGLKNKDIKQLLIVLSICDAFARLLSGFIFDLPVVSRNKVTWHAMLIIMACMCLFVVSFSNSKAVFFAALSCFAAFYAAHHTQHPNVLSDIVGVDHLTTAVGLMRFIVGCFAMLSPVIGGVLKDITGVYRMNYLLAACLGIFGTLIFLGHYHLRRRFCKPH